MTKWSTFKDVKLGFSRVWVKGDTLVLEWVINGKHHGELFGVKGKEEPIGHYGLSVVNMNSEGKVLAEHRYGELGTVMTQVGGGGAKAKPRPIPAIPASPEIEILTAGTPDEDKNVEVAKSVLGSLEAGKKEADFTNLLSDDIEQDGLFHLEMSKGKEGAKKFYKSFTTAFPDAKFETTKTLAVGDYAIVESVLKGTHKGALGTIQPTKNPVAVHLSTSSRSRTARSCARGPTRTASRCSSSRALQHRGCGQRSHVTGHASEGRGGVHCSTDPRRSWQRRKEVARWRRRSSAS